MRQYLSLVEEVLNSGALKKDRTGVGTISIFGVQRKYDLREGFPLLTTKKVKYDGVLYELLWFLRGSTNINDDLKQHTPIWNAWADENGDLGPIYGYQWRKWNKFTPDLPTSQTDRPIQNEHPAPNAAQAGQSDYSASSTEKSSALYQKSHIDQIQLAIKTIKKNPDSRRIIVSAWNVADLEQMKLPPCHLLFQFYVTNGRLDLQLYQRSADIALGVPFNIASYATLLQMVAQECDLTPGIFTHTLGDAHIYLNHIKGLKAQIERKPYPLPALKIAKKPFWELQYADFELQNYQHHPFIKFEVAV